MKIVNLLNNIVHYFTASRQVGHTSAAIHGVKTFGKIEGVDLVQARIVTASFSHAQQIERSEGVQTMALADFENGKAIGLRQALVFDNHAIVTLCGMALDAIQELGKEIQDLANMVSRARGERDAWRDKYLELEITAAELRSKVEVQAGELRNQLTNAEFRAGEALKMVSSADMRLSEIIKSALDDAGAPTHHPIIPGAEAAKPMMPQERIAWLGSRLSDCRKALNHGDILGNDGPFLLRYAASLISSITKIEGLSTVRELQEKAASEEAALKGITP